MTPQEIRDEFLNTLTHVNAIANKLAPLSGINRPLTFPDLHKLSEGLFLSAWSHWEEFTHTLLVHDLATDTAGALRREIRHFRTKGAPLRLAERMLNHPDHPNKFIEWSDYNSVVARAREFLAPGNRFVAHPLPRLNDLACLKRIRNAIAHKSDKAWESFTSLARAAPFTLTVAQMRGITPGRFLAAHQWVGQTVLVTSLAVVRDSAQHLVP